MSTYTITHTNASTGDVRDYKAVATAQFVDGDLARWEWMSEVQDTQSEVLSHTGEEGAMLLVWKGNDVIASIALGNAILD